MERADRKRPTVAGLAVAVAILAVALLLGSSSWRIPVPAHTGAAVEFTAPARPGTPHEAVVTPRQPRAAGTVDAPVAVLAVTAPVIATLLLGTVAPRPRRRSWSRSIHLYPTRAPPLFVG
jgi:hypothetical protein